MQKVVLFGAGLSSSVLIDYLLENAAKEDWKIRVGDMNLALAQKKVNGHELGEAFEFNVTNSIQRLNEISQADIVISMLPAHMHVDVAKECIALKKPMVTASYVSDAMQELHEEAIKAGVTIMNEIGVDPGIDHMSAMRVLDEIRENGGKMLQFESFTGGLVAPESDNNPWNYKFTWNPRNVVLAGSGGAVKFKQEGLYKFIPYHQLFRRTEIVEIPEYGRFEGYANRDSLKYREAYGLNDIPTIYRGTFRRPGFCRAWDVFVKLGATDDSYIMEGTENMTHRQFLNSFLAYNITDSVELKLMHYLKIEIDSDIMYKLTWLGMFDETPIGLVNATPAQILQHILEKKWQMEEHDLDMIVMYHLFGYELNGEKRQRESFMVIKGDDKVHTAMAKTVGLPVGIAAKMILTGKITKPGVLIPIAKEVYNPVLDELEHYGVVFKEKVGEYRGY
ncbi:MAG: saccharopine dehydrogenase NADP-binding domain-containing protein [Salibacteraceae bacterium]|jgi:saccharopine dehydrogenase-like NADP-dependent oxidoreductase|nr:saccharopine dehydrogenase NADP-binding domain-containing protein [Salibacteraceae bacterium]MDP4687675.1 saccharopine dehydrogenase NADP-binding domain-containing protein [Salibacteraceae bacterium]MDP4763710.1 saccharopine dehydrogenase NADP-binding domain-containing protein [Salibacteraceae bacterium]MDP4934623.1 saccharopine dehydrogenase NADP-binding domain-containing protein [Salibacteraceae bacterium]MDP4965598.1 saccharopine dehydrogenase NADP-binding domain-containing protein [Salib